jgi:flagellar biosynthesis component FlhA
MAIAQSVPQSTPMTGLMARNSDISLAGAVVAILVFMVMPLPTLLLDVLLAFSITFALCWSPCRSRSRWSFRPFPPSCC